MWDLSANGSKTIKVDEISRKVFVMTVFVFVMKRDRSEAFQHIRNRQRKNGSSWQPQRLSKRKTSNVGVLWKSMEKNVSRSRCKQSQGLLATSQARRGTQDSSVLEVRSWLMMLPSGFRDVVGHTPSCSGLRCEKWSGDSERTQVFQEFGLW